MAPNRKPHRPYSRYRNDGGSYGPPRTDGSLALAADFANDGFAFADKPTTTRDEVFWRQAGTGTLAPVKRQPKVEPEWYALVKDWTPTVDDERCFGGLNAIIKAAPVRTLALWAPPPAPQTVIALGPPRGVTLTEYKQSAQTCEDFERYLQGLRYQAFLKQNAAIKAA